MLEIECSRQVWSRRQRQLPALCNTPNRNLWAFPFLFLEICFLPNDHPWKMLLYRRELISHRALIADHDLSLHYLPGILHWFDAGFARYRATRNFPLAHIVYVL